jgi:plasmid stabilization system protein ParE
VKVVVSPRAQRQVRALKAWWDEHRRGANTRVEDSFAAAVAELAEHPDLGPIYGANPRYRTKRLRGTPYVLFYRTDREADLVMVVVAWSAKRGAGPELP